MSAVELPARAAADDTMSLCELNLEDPRWAAFVATRPEATAFHHPAWGTLLADCYGYRGLVLALVDSDGAIAAGLPLIEVRRPTRRREWICLPFTDECGPLGEKNLLLQLADAARTAADRNGVGGLEVRTALPAAPQGPAALQHELQLAKDPDAVFERFHRSRVQQVLRRAEVRSALTVRRMDTRDELVKAFYGLHLLTRHRLGVPVQPRRFFRLLWDRLVEPGLAYGVAAYSRREMAGAAVFLDWNGTVTYKYSAADRAYRHENPANLVLWEAIRASCEAGAQTFDLGRTDALNSGLRDFKRGWGAEEGPLVYSYLRGTPPAQSQWKASSAAGTFIRRSPLVVCRAAGELLYRYAA